MITNDAINRTLKRVEQEVPVETWTIDGVRMWPLIKADIASESFRAGRPVAGKLGPRRLIDRYPVRPAVEMTRTTAKRIRAKLDDGRHDEPPHAVDALFHSDGASFVRLDGKFYERFCDPVREQLAARGKSAAMLTPLSEFHVPRHASSLFIQSRLDRARLVARAINAVGRRHRTVLPELDRAVALMRETLPVGFVTKERYERLAVYLECYEAAYGKLLDTFQPKIVFIVCYYAIEPMALIRAARRRGIVTADLQHGCINESHFAYAGRHRFPQGGFDLLPDACWVWTEDEAETIEAWSGSRPEAPIPIVGGNPFLESWRNDTLPFVRDANRRFLGIAARAPGLAHVMFTAQGFETEAKLGRLADAIGRSNERFFWWVRLHPANPGARSTVEAALARSGTKNYVVQSHTEIPLYGVLRHMAAHVTDFSSTVIEAAAFGIPSVLTSHGESVMYAKQIEQGWAIVSDESNDLLAALSSQLAAAPEIRRRNASSSPASASRALDALFALAARERAVA